MRVSAGARRLERLAWPEKPGRNRSWNMTVFSLSVTDNRQHTLLLNEMVDTRRDRRRTLCL
jgi:hypothetical protein